MFSAIAWPKIGAKRLLLLFICCLVFISIVVQIVHATDTSRKHMLANGTVVAFQTDNGLYLSRINYGGTAGTNPIEAAKSTIDPYSQFTAILLSNGKFVFRADNGLYLRRINYGGIAGKNPIEAATSTIDPYCQFVLLPQSNGKVVLQADNGLYLSRINYGGTAGTNSIEAAKSTIDPYNQFMMTIIS
jgi:hypothetical protein